MSFRTKALGVAAVSIGISGYVFSTRSLDNLVQTHPDLQKVSECALSKTLADFVVVDGLRTAQEHLINVRNGKSWIKRSRHQDGKAVDVAAYVDGKITYDWKPYYHIANAFYYCSEQLNIPIVWGGEWKVQDLMHFELKREVYP
jgi:peptidoglycan L-alanyl-D-glutamate endopeptidase CwlK